MTLTTGTAEGQLRREMAELLDGHGQAMWALARKLCRHQQDAEDVFQETASRVWKHLASRPQIVNPRAWLMTITYRTFLDQRKKTKSCVALAGILDCACQNAPCRSCLSRGSEPCASCHRKPAGWRARSVRVALHGRFEHSRNSGRHGDCRGHGQEPTKCRTYPTAKDIAMKCEQFLPWLESESYVPTALARQHARRCESCRAAGRLLDQVKWELTTSDPLPERLKQAFLTMGETRAVRLPEPAENHRSHAARWLAVLAAAVLIGISPWLFSPSRQADVAELVRDHDSVQPGGHRRIGPITIVIVDSAGELAQLEVDLAALKTRLKATTADAQRLSAEEELARVLMDYQRLLAGNDAK